MNTVIVLFKLYNRISCIYTCTLPAICKQTNIFIIFITNYFRSLEVLEVFVCALCWCTSQYHSSVTDVSEILFCIKRDAANT